MKPRWNKHDDLLLDSTIAEQCEILFGQREWNLLNFTTGCLLDTEVKTAWLDEKFMNEQKGLIKVGRASVTSETWSSCPSASHTSPHWQGANPDQRRSTYYIVCCSITLAMYLNMPFCMMTWGTLEFLQDGYPNSCTCSSTLRFAVQFLKCVEEDPSVFEQTVISNETWVHHCEVESRGCTVKMPIFFFFQ